MNKIAKVLGNAAVAAVVVMNAEAIEVKKFSAKVYEAADMEEITKKDPFLTGAIKIFQDTYRAHLDELRDKNKSDLLRVDNWKYFLTLYDVIITEITKMAFDIKVIGDSVNYVDKTANDIIKCSSDGYDKIEKYNQGNWNYLLLINVLNQVKHSTQKIDEKLIQNTANTLAKDENYSAYASQLDNAARDIKHYFKELRLYEWLTQLRTIIKTKWSNTQKKLDKIAEMTSLSEIPTHDRLEIAFDKSKYTNKELTSAQLVETASNGKEYPEDIEITYTVDRAAHTVTKLLDPVNTVPIWTYATAPYSKLTKDQKQFFTKEFVYLYPIFANYTNSLNAHILLKEAECTALSISEIKQLNIYLVWQLTMSSTGDTESIVRKPGTYMINLLRKLLHQISSPEIQKKEVMTEEDDIKTEAEISTFISQISKDHN